MQVILYLMIIIRLYRLWYSLYQFLPTHTNVWCVFWNYYIVIIIIFIFYQICENSQREVILKLIGLLTIILKQLSIFIRGIASSPNSELPLSHHLSTFGFLCNEMLSIVKFSYFHHRVLFCFNDGSYSLWYPLYLWYMDVTNYHNYLPLIPRGPHNSTPKLYLLRLPTLFSSSAPCAWTSTDST